MNNFEQIRERFLADTRQHFFASDTTASMPRCTARPNGNPCSASDTRFRPAGI